MHAKIGWLCDAMPYTRVLLNAPFGHKSEMT